MSTPWDDLLIHDVDVTRFAPAQDADAGAVNNYPAPPYVSCAQCFVHPDGVAETYDNQNRRTIVNQWTVLFQTNYGFAFLDRIDWQDGLGVTRGLYIQQGIRDGTPQGGLCKVMAQERL